MKKILVVDDDKDLLFLLEERLKEEGYDVVTTDNAESGLSLAKSEKVDLLILDVIMPGKDGTYVAEKLQVDPVMKKVPIIFLTGLYSKEEEKTRGHLVANKVFLAKPYEIEDLLVEIEKLT
jgi:DNA-binding response OmpR family regulator